MKTTDFEFVFPDALIAHQPADKRDHSRLMVLNRSKQTIEHRVFFQVIDYLDPGDLLVLNDTKVIPANLVGRKEDGGAKVEVLLVNRKQKTEREKQEAEIREQVWECLVKPGKRLSVGSKVVFGDDELVGTVLEKTESGEQIIEFETKGDFWEIVRRLGETPLPPYIKRISKFKDQSLKSRKAGSRLDYDMESGQAINQKKEIQNRYQTVYAAKEGASAAPTAGLHFTPELLEKIKTKGVKIAYVTLHTGLATFKPVYAENIEDHKMYSEYFEIPEETIAAIEKAKRVIAVGTTSVRVLETLASLVPDIRIPRSPCPGSPDSQIPNSKLLGSTDIFIYPGYKFKVVDALITNFHWPKSTLIMLVSAFAGKDFIFRAYEEAIRQGYRFFSFGDAMLIE